MPFLYLALYQFNKCIMEINYLVVVPVLILVIALILFLIRRNRKDQKKLEQELNESELKPEKHDKDHL